jgi:hypothetical protein
VEDAVRASGFAGTAGDVSLLGSITATGVHKHLAAPNASLGWPDSIDARERERISALGRQLVQLVEEYIVRRRSRPAVLAESQAIGVLYGRELIAFGVSLRQALQAFTLFRRELEDAGRRYATACGVADGAEDLRDHLDVLNDRLLLGIAEAYDEPTAAVASAAPSRHSPGWGLTEP